MHEEDFHQASGLVDLRLPQTSILSGKEMAIQHFLPATGLLCSEGLDRVYLGGAAGGWIARDINGSDYAINPYDSEQ